MKKLSVLKRLLGVFLVTGLLFAAGAAAAADKTFLSIATGPEEFRSDLQRSLKVLAELTGERIRGYRAPSWSARKEFEWFWRILAEEGIKYDSNLFPLQIKMLNLYS